MGRKEVLALGLVASLGYIAAGAYKFGSDHAFGLLLAAIGAYGLIVLVMYRRLILT